MKYNLHTQYTKKVKYERKCSVCICRRLQFGMKKKNADAINHLSLQFSNVIGFGYHKTKYSYISKKKLVECQGLV